MASDGIDVRYVAKLARLALSDAQVDQYGAQLGALLEHVQVLQKLDTSAIAATAQVIEARNVERDDVVVPGLAHAVVMAGAPDAQHGFFRVPQIIASEE
jgi:aspartyl-tRNA(Asn)/glutamyl-tRNA(Gln) amidotransferase subunit C